MVPYTIRVRSLPLLFEEKEADEGFENRYRFPLELVSAVFDLVFAEGVEAIFRFAIALIKRNEDVLLKLEFEDLIEFLKNGLFEVYAVSRGDSSHHCLLGLMTGLLRLQPTREEKEKNEKAPYKVRDFVREALQVRITPMMLVRSSRHRSMLLSHVLKVPTVERRINSVKNGRLSSLLKQLTRQNSTHYGKRIYN